MNVRKPTDYSAMFEALDVLMAANLPPMELYRGIGRMVSGRPEKGAAVAAAEYLQGTYPDATGFSPRSLRRMRDFCRTYESIPEVMAEAMTIGLAYSPGEAQIGGAWHRLCRKNAAAAHPLRLRRVRPPDRDGPGQHTEYSPYLRRRCLLKAFAAGLYHPPRRCCRPMVYG